MGWILFLGLASGADVVPGVANKDVLAIAGEGAGDEDGAGEGVAVDPCEDD